MSNFFEDNNPTPWEEDGFGKKIKLPKIRISDNIPDITVKNSTNHTRKTQNTPKKSMVLISVIITAVILLFSVLTLAIGVSDNSSEVIEKVPTITNIEALDNYPLLRSELEDDTLTHYSYDVILNPAFSCINYRFKVTLSDGREYVLSLDEEIYDIIPGYAYLTIEGEIPTNELGEVITSSENTADINISAKIYQQDTASDYCITEMTGFCSERQISDGIVSDIRCTGQGEVYTYENSDEYYVEGGEFEITYTDGKKVTAKPEMSEDGTYQTLDGHRLYVDFDYEIMDKAYISILDCSDPCEVDFTEKEYPFKDISIIDCQFNDNYEITSISYTITTNDGTALGFTDTPNEFDSIMGYRLSTVCGFTIYAEPRFVYSDGKASVSVKLSLGFITDEPVFDEAVYPLPESKNSCECSCHDTSTEGKKSYEIIRPVMEAFGFSAFCECGNYHHYIKIMDY